jgi:hypothetical protein
MQQFRRAFRRTFLTGAAVLASAVFAPRSAVAQNPLTFDPSNSCPLTCTPFDTLRSNYGSTAGVNATHGALTAFGSVGFTEQLHWYGGFGPFSSGFDIGNGGVAAFILTATDPLATIQFDQVQLSSSGLRTATVNFYTLSNVLIPSTSVSVSVDCTGCSLGPSGITTVNTPVSAIGGLIIEFGIAPGGLTNLEIDNLQYTLVPSTAVTPEPATMSLMALGLVGMVGVRRRKRSR